MYFQEIEVLGISCNATLELISPQHTLRCMAKPSFLCLILIVKVHVRDAMYDVLTRALTRTLDDQTSNLKKNDDFETYLGPGGRNQRLNK